MAPCDGSFYLGLTQRGRTVLHFLGHAYRLTEEAATKFVERVLEEGVDLDAVDVVTIR